MREIKKNELSDFCVTGEFDIVASVKPEQGSEEQKTVTLRFRMTSTPIQDIINSSLKDKRINWQVKGREKFSSILDKSIIQLDYKGGRSPVDAKAEYKSRLATMTPEERAKEIAELQAMK